MSETKSKSLIIFVYAILALSIVIVFGQTRNFDFITLDDMIYVSENTHVITGINFDNFLWAFESTVSANWHPLTWLSLMLDCQLFGQNPGRIHIVNVFFHLLNTLLLFSILKRMTGVLWPSAFVAAAFALHPMHVESVAWISERKDVLSTFFMMLTLTAYISYVRKGGILLYGLTILGFIFGLLSKPMLVTLPFVFLLLDFWPLNRFSAPAIKASGQKSGMHGSVWANYRTVIIEKIPFFLLSTASSVITFIMQQKAGAMTDITRLALPYRLANAIVSYTAYIGKMLWPINMAAFYPFDTAKFVLWQICLTALLLVGISVIVIILGRKRKHRYLPVGWFWFLGTLVPVIGLVQVGEQSMADRYTYIPYIGLFIIIAWGMPELISNWRAKKAALGIAGIAAIIAMTISSYIQTGYWKNSLSLFSHAIEVTRNNYIAHAGFGEELRKQGNSNLAIEHLTKAIELKPDYSDAILNLGSVMTDRGNTAAAIEYLKKALELKPDFAKAHYNLGIVWQKEGNIDEAISHYERALSLMPDFPNAHYNMAAAAPDSIQVRRGNHSLYTCHRIEARFC